MIMSKRLEEIAEKIRRQKVKKRLKSAFRRKKRPSKIRIKDEEVDLASSCSKAIAAQKRLIDIYGDMEIFRFSLNSLELQLNSLIKKDK